MMKRESDHEMPRGQLKRIQDVLPAPGELIMPEETIKVTIALKKSSISFFKFQAKKHHTKYQRMIREVLDRYATQYQ